jgi:hypothetical protein
MNITSYTRDITISFSAGLTGPASNRRIDGDHK